MISDKTKDAAKGKWRGILLSLGLPESCLKDKHGPCPLCGGTDRFRWDNKNGSGSYICGQCGAGDGMKLAMEFTGRGFRDICGEIDGLVGNIKFEAPRRAMTEDDARQLMREVYAQTVPVQPGDLVHRYLESRRIDEMIYPASLRFGAALRDGEGGVRPCMVAMVGVYGEMDDRGRQRYASMHRTFLRPDGGGKADMQSPRKMMPGELPDGACVMLSRWTHSGAIGIAEGIETAMSASAIFGIPVWAAISSAGLAKWSPPPDAEEVVIFADNDKKFGGQAAAYALAHRLAVRRGGVSVQVPTVAGEDWADVHMRKSNEGRA